MSFLQRKAADILGFPYPLGQPAPHIFSLQTRWPAEKTLFGRWRGAYLGHASDLALHTMSADQNQEVDFC